MKRWQDRGEVEDSEGDEDLSLDGDTPSPERPHKKARLAQNDSAGWKGVSVPPERSLNDEDDGNWVRAKVATTYGRKGRTPKQASAPVSRRQTPGKGVGHATPATSLDLDDRMIGERQNCEISFKQNADVAQADPIVSPLLRSTTGNDVDSSYISSVSLAGRKIDTPANGIETVTRIPAPLESIVQPQLSTSVLLKWPMNQDTFGENSAVSEQPTVVNIAAVSETLGRQSEDLLPSTRSAPHCDDFLRLSDLLSSPLSERDVSPPLEFLTEKTAVSSRLSDDDEPLSEADSLPQDGGDAEITSLASAGNARRSLRARKEKQLHPYMYDKAQYQKQFRERGLKPVRVVEQATQNEESQSASQSAASQSSGASLVPTPTASQALRPPSTATIRLDYFDAADGSSEDELGSHHSPTKRKKFGPTDDTRPGRLPTRKYAARPSALPGSHDAQTVPLSPPRTSSDYETSLVTASRSPQAVPVFRLPLGRVPAAPPTPQISSDTRPRNSDSELSGDDDLRRSIGSRRRSDTDSPVLSSSESEQEAIIQAEAKRLRREQKRIKGVLPASWLRIDFRKQRDRQSPSPTGRRNPSAGRSPIREPQRGLARKVMVARPRREGSPGLRAIAAARSDDSDASMQDVSVVPRQMLLTFEDDRSLMVSNEAAVDDEDMENDYVDPMLAGISRPAGSKKRATKQPRISDAFRKEAGLRAEFADDRSHRKRNARSVRHPVSEQQKRRRSAHRPPPPVRLSIVDAPRSTSDSDTALPQFMRLAVRRARREPGRGRHSPTGKTLRLPTADDTEEAAAALRAWRAGAIAPLPSQSSMGCEDLLSRDSSMPTINNLVPLSNFPANGYNPRINRTGGSKSTAPALRSRQEPRDPPDRTQRANLPPSRRRYRVLHHSHLRSVQLETLESDFDQMHRSMAFERRMQSLTESIALPERQSRAPGFQLARFLRTDQPDTPNDKLHDTTTQAARSTAKHIPHRPRKSFARRLDTGSRQYRQPSEPIPDLSIENEHLQTSVGISGPVLEGLGTFGTRYSGDFDVEPLGLGTSFLHTTFIGSGELNDALSLTKRNLSFSAGHMRVQLDGEMREWGSWNEDVAASFARIPQAIIEALQTLDTGDLTLNREQQEIAVDSNIDYLLRSVVRYCSKCMYFVDSVDRQSCAESLLRLVVDLTDAVAAPTTEVRPLLKTGVKLLQYQLVITKQASLICHHPFVAAAIKTQLNDLLLYTSRRLANGAVAGHFDELRSFYEENRQADRRGTGVDSGAYVISSIVILNSILPTGGSKSVFWPAICSTIGTEVNETCVVSNFERLWYDLFSLLPALEFTATGTVCPGSRLVRPQEDWTLPQALLDRAFQLYETSSEVRGYSVNDYVRALLRRCYTLITKWGWWRCESVLNIIYDFFSRRGLALLNKEDGRGSPKFLDDLGKSHVELEVHNDDRSFHIFLKILASGLVGMSKHQLHGARKIQSIAWRLIPNHNRSYRKDADVARSTLDALRNHHDLICTLYFASPPGHRPGVHLLRELVDHSTSHREACRLNVRSWVNIASFQASTTESIEVLRPLTSWFADIVRTTTAQYRLAKSEAQQAFDQAKGEGANPSEALLESTVAKNQSQISATLVDALAGLKRALNSAGSLAIATSLVRETSFWTVFDLFDPSQRRLVSAMAEALHVIEIALDVEERPTSTAESQPSSSDSQEFGDSDALQEFAANEKTNPNVPSIVEILLEPVGHFMSNALGSDVAPDDNILRKAIDIWVRLANATVKHAKRSWLNYVDDYSVTGWGQMRNTAQKRKFTTYFMSRVVDQITTLDVEIKLYVITAWLLSLVEREAVMKFQHVLTSALLNRFSNEGLLQNLPFARDSKGNFDMNLSELRQRRLALISSVLSNMREDCEQATLRGPDSARKVREPHEKMLRQMMGAMKNNFQELQTSREGADTSIQGAYVEFVQQVVSFMQQHTTGICKIDSFFTDSTVFPLPSDDPTYVVGRLKGYVPKLCVPKIRKELAAFVQSVGERAAVDNQQPYLVNQMATAMGGVTELGHQSSPSLRHLLLTTIFPAYIGNAFVTACSWIPVLPILQACEQVIPDLLYSVDIENESSVTAASESAIAVLHEIVQQFSRTLREFSGIFVFSHITRTLSAMLRVGTSCLTFASFLRRATSQGVKLMKQLQALRELSIQTEGHLEGLIDAGMFEASVLTNPPVSPWPDTKSYSETQLRNDMNLHWYAEEGRYYLKRNRVQEAVMHLQDSEEERKRLLRGIAEFCEAYDAVLSVRGRRRRYPPNEDRWIEHLVI